MPPFSVLKSYKIGSLADSQPPVVDPTTDALSLQSYDTLTRDGGYFSPVAGPTFHLQAHASQLSAEASFADSQYRVVDPTTDALSLQSYETFKRDGGYFSPIAEPTFHSPAHAPQFTSGTNVAHSQPSVVNPTTSAVPLQSYHTLARDGGFQSPNDGPIFYVPAHASQLNTGTIFDDANPVVASQTTDALPLQSIDTLTHDRSFLSFNDRPMFNIPAYASQLTGGSGPLAGIAPRERTPPSFRPANKRMSSNLGLLACSARPAAFGEPSAQLISNATDSWEAECVSASPAISTPFRPLPSVASPRHGAAYNVPASSPPPCGTEVNLSPPHRPHDSPHAMPSGEDLIPSFNTIRRVDPSMAPVPVRRRQVVMRPLYNAVTEGYSSSVPTTSPYGKEDTFRPQSGIDRRQGRANDTVPRFTPLACNVASTADDDVGGRLGFGTEPIAWQRGGTAGGHEMRDVAPVDAPFRPPEPRLNLCLFAPDLCSVADLGGSGAPMCLETASQAASEALCGERENMSASVCQRPGEVLSCTELIAKQMSEDHTWQPPAEATARPLLSPELSTRSPSSTPSDLVSFYATPSSARKEVQNTPRSVSASPRPASLHSARHFTRDQLQNAIDLSPTIFSGAQTPITTTKATVSTPQHSEGTESFAGTALPNTVLPAVHAIVSAPVVAIAANVTSAVSVHQIEGSSVTTHSECTPKTNADASAPRSETTTGVPSASTQLSTSMLVADGHAAPQALSLTKPPVTPAQSLPSVPFSPDEQADSVLKPKAATSGAASSVRGGTTLGAPSPSMQGLPSMLEADACAAPKAPSPIQVPVAQAACLPSVPLSPVAQEDTMLTPRIAATTAASAAHSVTTAGASSASTQMSSPKLGADACTASTVPSLAQSPVMQAPLMLHLASSPDHQQNPMLTPRTTATVAAPAAHSRITAGVLSASTETPTPMLEAGACTAPKAPSLAQPSVTHAPFLPSVPSSPGSRRKPMLTPKTAPTAASAAHPGMTAGAASASTQMSPSILVAAPYTAPKAPLLTQPPVTGAPSMPSVPFSPVPQPPANPARRTAATAASPAQLVVTEDTATALVQASRATLSADAWATQKVQSLSRSPATQALALPPTPLSPVMRGQFDWTARSNSRQPATALANRGVVESRAASPQRGRHVASNTGYPQEGGATSPTLTSSRGVPSAQLGYASPYSVRGSELHGRDMQKADPARSMSPRAARSNDNWIHATRYHVNQPTGLPSPNSDNRYTLSVPRGHCIEDQHGSPLSGVTGRFAPRAIRDTAVPPSVRRALTPDNDVNAVHCLVNRLNGIVNPFIARCDACRCVVFDGVAYEADSLLQLASLQATSYQNSSQSQCHMILDRELLVSVQDIAREYRAATKSPRRAAYQLEPTLPPRVMEAALRLLSNERRTDRHRRILERDMLVVICRDGFMWPLGTMMQIVEVGWCIQGDDMQRAVMGPAIMTVDDTGRTYVLDADGVNLSYVEIR